MTLNHLEKRWSDSGNLSSEAFTGFSRLLGFERLTGLWKTSTSSLSLSLLSLGSISQFSILSSFCPLGPMNVFWQNFCSGLFSCLFFTLPSSPVLYTHSTLIFWKHRSKDPNFLPPQSSARIKNGLEDFRWSDPHFYFYFSTYSFCVSCRAAIPSCLLLPEIDTDLHGLVSFSYALPSVWELPPFSSIQMMTILRISLLSFW